MHWLRLACIGALLTPETALSLPLGQWLRGDGNTRVRIERCGKALCAINTWVNDTSQGERVGHRLEMTVNPAGERRLVGSAFDPQRDRSYGITIEYSPDHMSTRGCLLGVLCKTVNWTRIQ